MQEIDYLDSFQSGSRFGLGMETALVALSDDLCQKNDRDLILLDLLAVCDTINDGLLERVVGLGVGDTDLVVPLLQALPSAFRGEA